MLHFYQEAEAGIEVPNTTTESGVSSLPTTDSGTEEPQGPKEKAPVRFGWVTGVMVSEVCVFEPTEHNLFYCISNMVCLTNTHRAVFIELDHRFAAC